MDEAARQAQANEKLAAIGGNIHGKDGRAMSLATRSTQDA